MDILAAWGPTLKEAASVPPVLRAGLKLADRLLEEHQRLLAEDQRLGGAFSDFLIHTANIPKIIKNKFDQGGSDWSRLLLFQWKRGRGADRIRYGERGSSASYNLIPFDHMDPRLVKDVKRWLIDLDKWRASLD